MWHPSISLSSSSHVFLLTPTSHSPLWPVYMHIPWRQSPADWVSFLLLGQLAPLWTAVHSRTRQITAGCSWSICAWWPFDLGEEDMRYSEYLFNALWILTRKLKYTHASLLVFTINEHLQQTEKKLSMKYIFLLLVEKDTIKCCSIATFLVKVVVIHKKLCWVWGIKK